MKIKTSELTDAALDWAVAKAEGLTIDSLEAGNVWVYKEDAFGNPERIELFRPHRNWAQGGPIIERLKGFQFKQWLESKPETCCEAHIHNYDGDWVAFGPTPLIAAMRCFVASKLGDEVDVPDELCL